MKYVDRVYGEIDITEPVILELIETPSMQRLKDIDLAGYRPLWVKSEADINAFDHSRFAHSLGVFLLLYKYNLQPAEQIAGLIHDVSHSAFSHGIDYALDAGSEKEHSHQDNIFRRYVVKTAIPRVLEKFGFDPDYILDDHNFPFKENNLPDLCADRIDYSLRTALIFGELDESEKDYLLGKLHIAGNDWVFEDMASAKKFAELFFKLNRVYYSDLKSAIMFRVTGDCLRYALQKGCLTESDLYTTDSFVTEKIRKLVDQDERLKLLWGRMNNEIKIINDPDDYDVSVFCKSRVVDPLYRENAKICRVSDNDPVWSETVISEAKPKQYFLKFYDEKS